MRAISRVTYFYRIDDYTVKLILIFILVFFIQSLQAQSKIDSKGAVLQYGISLHKASILVHNKDLKPVDNSYPTGLQFDFAWQQRKRESWEKCHCFPKLGLSVVLWDYDAPDILGKGLSALFFLEPEYGANSRISFSVKAGFGLSYLSNPYHPENNVQNQAYSTNINFALYLAAKSGIKLSDQSKLDAAIFFHHNSNGGVASPNRGLNYPSISLGYSRYVRPPNFEAFGKKEWDRNQVMKRLDLSPYLSWKQITKGTHVYSPGLEAKGSKQVGKINALTLGIEYLQDNAQRYILEQEGKNTESQKFSSAIGHEFLIGNLLFSQQFGVYIYRSYKEGADVYQRYGLTYNFFPWLAFGVNLKAHGNVAQLVDFRAVFSIRRNSGN